MIPTPAGDAATEPAARRGWRRWALFACGLAVAAGFVVAIARSVDPAAVGSALASAHPGLLLFGLIPLALGYALRITRWRILLLSANPRLSWSACAAPLLGGFALNNVLPGRAGDVVRVVAYRERLGVGTAAAAGSVMIERILDLMVLVGLLMLGLAVVPHEQLPAGMARIGGWVGGAIIACGVAVVLAAGWLRPRLADFAADRPGLLPRLAGIAARVLLCMDLVRSPWRLAVVAIASVLVWVGELGLYWCVARSLDLPVGLAGPLLAMAAGNLATLIPGTPGHVGTFHFFAAAAMVAAGADRDDAVACAILVHLLFWGSTTLAGTAALVVSGRRPAPRSGSASSTTSTPS